MGERRIWKWTIRLVDEQTIHVPVGASPLDVQVQGDHLVLWALVDATAPSELRTVRIVGTGNPVQDDPGVYVGTVQIHGGSLVWHVFMEASDG